MANIFHESITLLSFTIHTLLLGHITAKARSDLLLQTE